MGGGRPRCLPPALRLLSQEDQFSMQSPGEVSSKNTQGPHPSPTLVKIRRLPTSPPDYPLDIWDPRISSPKQPHACIQGLGDEASQGPGGRNEG